MFVDFIWIKKLKQQIIIQAQHNISNISVNSNLMLSDLWFLCEENMCAAVFIYNDRFLWMTHLSKSFLQAKKIKRM